MDGVTLIKNDHQTVEKLFQRYEKLGPKSYRQAGQIRDKVCTELTIHAEIEELILYPATREVRGETEEMIKEAEQEHEEAKTAIAELQGLSPEDVKFPGAMGKLIGGVRHHVKEEEGEILPKIRKGMSRADLEELGQQLADAKRDATRRLKSEQRAA
jgi:hemerythrin superfamily protein